MSDKVTERRILGDLTAILRRQFPRLSKAGFEPGNRLMEDLGLDSVEMVSLQVALEDRFDIRFDPLRDDLSEAFKTVGGLSRYIARHPGRG